MMHGKSPLFSLNKRQNEMKRMYLPCAVKLFAIGSGTVVELKDILVEKNILIGALYGEVREREKKITFCIDTNIFNEHHKSCTFDISCKPCCCIYGRNKGIFAVIRFDIVIEMKAFSHSVHVLMGSVCIFGHLNNR